MYRYVSVDSTEGSTRDISCNKGYMATSNDTNITCLATGDWFAIGVECIVFAHADVTPLVGPPYWITASGLNPLLPCKLAKFSN